MDLTSGARNSAQSTSDATEHLNTDSPAAINRAEGSEDLAMLFCPVCSARLHAHRCKLICDGCGYFMSCADYY
jgi:hypothetical protein